MGKTAINGAMVGVRAKLWADILPRNHLDFAPFPYANFLWKINGCTEEKARLFWHVLRIAGAAEDGLARFSGYVMTTDHPTLVWEKENAAISPAGAFSPLRFCHRTGLGFPNAA